MKGYEKLLINFGTFLTDLEKMTLRAHLPQHTIIIIQVDSTLDYHAPGLRTPVHEQAQRILDQVHTCLGGAQPDYVILPQADGIMAMRIKKEFPEAGIVVLYDGSVDSIVPA